MLDKLTEKIGSVFSNDYNIHSEIDTLNAELRTIESVKDMVATQGWQDLATWIIGRISDLSDDILSLADNASDNKKEIERKKWSVSLYESLISTIGTTLDREAEINNKLIHLKEVARIAELK